MVGFFIVMLVFQGGHTSSHLLHIFTSAITVGRSVLGSCMQSLVDLAKHEDFTAGLSGPAPC